MAEHPKVFISYSRDSSEHEQWVSELGAKLRHNDVNVILDQQDLGLGTGLAQFMEVSVRDCDRVLVICTDNYVRKANNREGGVGYEIEIVTAHLFQNLGTNKFIPIIRQASGQEKMPTCLGTRAYIDFTDDSQFNEKFNDLLHKLYEVPVVQKPPLGEKPTFDKQKAPPSEEADAQLPDIPEQFESASDAYSTAVKLARAGDEFGWRQLVKQIKPSVFRSLVQWRQNELDGQRPESKEQLVRIADKAVEIISPLISVALVGVESGREQFRDQKSILDDLLNIAGWNPVGYTVWVNMPDALGYVYHSLHGSLSLNTYQLDLALDLTKVKISVVDGTTPLPVWETGYLMGGCKSLGDSFTEGWKYLFTGYEKWEWLAPIFGSELEYQTSLVAYYMALNIHELATIIASGQQDMLEESLSPISSFVFNVPLTFLSKMDRDITKRAILLLRNQEELPKIWACLNVTREEMEGSWQTWIGLVKNKLRRMAGSLFYPIINPSLDIYQNFFEGL